VNAWIVFLLVAATSASHAEDKPNIVLLCADNFGYGELGSSVAVLLTVRQHRASMPWLAKAWRGTMSARRFS